MIVLTASESMRITLSDATSVDYAISYIDTGTDTPGISRGTYATASTTSILAAPSSGQRIVKSAYISNAAATPNTITVTIYDGATGYRVSKTTLQENETLAIDDAGLRVLEARSTSATNAEIRNKIINGNFNIWQRNTTTTTTNTYGADRFRHLSDTDGVFTSSQETSILPNAQSRFCWKSLVGTADTSIGASQAAGIRYDIEGTDFLAFAGKTFTLSFYVRSSKTGSYSVAFRNSAVNRSYVTAYTINTANTWEKKTITATHDTTGTWLYDNGIGMSVFWALAAGSNFITSPNAWTAGQFVAATGQTNWLNTVSENFYLSQVQMELGDTATSFENVHIQTEIDRCRRYYRKTFPLTTTPAPTAINTTAVGTQGVLQGPQVGAGGANVVLMTWDFNPPMRAVPTITYHNPSINNPSTGWNQAQNLSAGQPCTGAGTGGVISENKLAVALINYASGTTGQTNAVHITADADYY